MYVVRPSRADRSVAETRLVLAISIYLCVTQAGTAPTGPEIASLWRSSGKQEPAVRGQDASPRQGLGVFNIFNFWSKRSNPPQRWHGKMPDPQPLAQDRKPPLVRESSGELVSVEGE